ncbi:MAG TPA: NlpC/P60 family protein [Pseudonocardiaceae bacterium]
MASDRLKRTARGVLATGVIVAAVGLTSTQATAAPPDSSPSGDSMQQYQQLSKQADALNEQINSAKVDLQKKNAQVTKANSAIVAATHAEQSAEKQEDQYRGQVDQLTDASFEGARLNQLSALLTGTSARDFLNKATDLEYLAADNFSTLNKFSVAANTAKAAEQRGQQAKLTAQTAANAATATLAQLNAKNQQLTAQIAKVHTAITKLTASQQHSLNTDTGPAGSFIAPPGIAGAAMQIALDQRGKPYAFGGAGPSVFDCSGLVMYAYAQAGMPGLPHSAAAQQGLGVSVSRADLRPGDLVFFGSPAGHVGIYVGNGMMINAPQTGEVVRVEPLLSDYSGARRLGN